MSLDAWIACVFLVAGPGLDDAAADGVVVGEGDEVDELLGDGERLGEALGDPEVELTLGLGLGLGEPAGFVAEAGGFGVEVQLAEPDEAGLP